MTAVATSLSCAMCGTVFDPHTTSACDSCPLSNGCSLSCCPACGFSSVDVGRSRLGRLLLRIGASAGRRKAAPAPAETLAEARDGDSVHVDRLEGLPHWQEHQLAAYGIAPGRRIDVVQTSPVVVVRVDYAEVAFERSLARGVRLSTSDGASASSVSAVAIPGPGA